MAFLWPIPFEAHFMPKMEGNVWGGSLAELMVFGDGLLPAWELPLLMTNGWQPTILGQGFGPKRKEGTRMRAIWPQSNFGQSIFGRKMDNSQRAEKAVKRIGQLAERMVDLKGGKWTMGSWLSENEGEEKAMDEEAPKPLKNVSIFFAPPTGWTEWMAIRIQLTQWRVLKGEEENRPPGDWLE